MEIKNVAVIGAGTMGNGIAHVLSLKNISVEFVDIDESLVEKGINNISMNMDRQIKKEIISAEEKEKALANIKPVTGIENVNKNSNMIIEAATENFEIKSQLFASLHNNIYSDSIFASNTSSISITELSAKTRPDKFIGMHFMNPVPVMKLVEIIRGYSTSDETFEAVKNLALDLDKTPVEVQDYPGFIANRILMPMINEAIFSLYEGVASKEDIDTVMKLGMNHPMGPLTLADFIGLDVCLAIMNVLYEGFNDPKYRACPLLKKMVAANKLGRKTKEGFYKYD